MKLGYISVFNESINSDGICISDIEFSFLEFVGKLEELQIICSEKDEQK